MHSNDLIDTRKVAIAALRFFIIHSYDKTKKDKKNLTHFIDTTSQFIVAAILNFKCWRSTGAGSGTKTFTGGLEPQQNFRKIRSLAENICHVLRNSKKIFRFLDFLAAAT